MASGRRVASVIRSLVNARDLQLECARFFHETFLVPVFIYGSETMLWKESSTVRAVQMVDLRGLLGIRRKGLDERIDEGILRWFGHVERMESDKIAKRVYVGECAGSRSVGRPRKR